MSSSSSSEGEEDNEVVLIKRAMREAKARKRSLTSRMKSEWERGNQEKDEMQSLLRATNSRLDDTKKRVSELEFDLREAKFELNQLTNAYTKLKEERATAEKFHRNDMQDMQQRMETQTKLYLEKSHVITLECEKISKLLENFCHNQDANARSENISRTKRHLLDRALAAVNKINAIAATVDAPSPAQEMVVPSGSLSSHSQRAQLASKAADTAVDGVMLDMCRQLEEENVALGDEVESLKEQLAEAKREASASKLIPHYRLAIVRARTYAANLSEQIEREKATSHALREQLDETYRDLKKVVEEKRKLYKRLNKQSLQAEQHDYLTSKDLEEETSRKGGSPQVNMRMESSIPARERSPPSFVSALSATPNDGKTPRKRSSLVNDELEEELRRELSLLDGQIDILKDKLGKAAMMQSQRILAGVIDSSLSKLKGEESL